MSPRVLTATTNANGTINFPEYTFPSTPYYVKQTLWNQYGPFAIVNRLRGLPIPAPRFGSNGVTWESVGAKQADNNRQLIAETRVLLKYSELMNNAWGFRPNINWQYKSIAVNRLMGRGYGSPLNAYQPDALVRLWSFSDKTVRSLIQHSQHTCLTSSRSQFTILLLLAPEQPRVIGSSGHHGSSYLSTLHLTPFSMSDRLLSTVSIHFPLIQLHSWRIAYLTYRFFPAHGTGSEENINWSEVAVSVMTHNRLAIWLFSSFKISRQSRSHITPVLMAGTDGGEALVPWARSVADSGTGHNYSSWRFLIWCTRAVFIGNK